MLSFEVRSDGIAIACDEEGVKTIVEALEWLKADRNHIHLRSPSCGGRDIDDRTPWDDPAVGMVTITWFGE